MSIILIFIFSIINCINKIATITGMPKLIIFVSSSCGIICKKAITIALKYPTHFIGLYCLNALKYSCNEIIATIDHAISIIYLFPNSRTTITIGNPSIAELILLTSILRSFLFSPTFSISSIKFFNCFIKVFTCKIWP